MIYKVKCNGQVVTPDNVETQLRDGTMSLAYIQSSEWTVGYLDTTLILKYDGYTYICMPSRDIDEDYPWDEDTDKWYVKYGFLRAGQEEFELPDFDPPEGVDIKRPDNTQFSAEYEWEHISFGDLVIQYPEWETLWEVTEDMDCLLYTSDAADE